MGELSRQSDSHSIKPPKRSEDVERLAERLGLEPLAEGESTSITLVVDDSGKRYDLIAMVNAVLDRMERTAGDG